MPPTRRYICSFCAKSFLRSEHKSRHERSHTNEKPFSCSICFAKFVRRDLLQRHLRTVHNEHNPSKLINTSPALSPEPLATTTTNDADTSAAKILNGTSSNISSADNCSSTSKPVQDSSTSAKPASACPSKLVDAQVAGTATAADPGSQLHTTNKTYSSDANPDESLVSSSIISSNFYSLSERNLILLLTLSKKFANLDLVDGKVVPTNIVHDIEYLRNKKPIISSSKISNYLLIWGTISNIKFPVILNLNKLLSLSTIPVSGNQLLSQTDRPVSSYPSSSAHNNTVYNSCLFYAVLAFGAAEFGQFSDCLKLFNVCWSLILQRMEFPEEIIEPLTILAYVSFNYLQELYYYKPPDNTAASKLKSNTVSIHTIFQCLNEVIFLLISSNFDSIKRSKSYHGSISLSTINYYKSHGLPIPADLVSQEATPHLINTNIDNELFNYWYTYNLLSSYSLNFGKSPPKIHSIFLNKILPTNNDYHLMSTETQVKSINKAGNKVVDINKKIDFLSNETLKDALGNLSKSPTLLKNLIASDGNTSNNINSLTNAIFPTNTFKNLTLRENCIIMGLSNELQSLRLSESNFFNNNKNSLHNSIIMANKSLNTNSNYQQFSTNSRTVNPSSSTTTTTAASPTTHEDSQYSLLLNSPYSSHVSSPANITYSRNVSTFGSKSHGVHSPNEPNLNIVNNTTINSNSNYLFSVNNFSNMIVNNNINQDLINIYNLIIILKKKVLINCDNKLIQDLLIDYIIIPNHEIYWNLLYITIKEFTFINSDFTQWNEMDDETMKHKFQQSYYQASTHPRHLHGSASFSNGAYGIGPYTNDHLFSSSFNGFADLIHDIMRDVNVNDVCSKITKFLVGSSQDNVIINNNLGLTSLPLLFIGYLISSLSPQNLANEGFRNFNVNSPEDIIMNFLNLNTGSTSNSNLVFLKFFLKLPKNFVNLLIEDFFILIKIFYSFRKQAITKTKQETDEDTAHIAKKQKIHSNGSSLSTSTTSSPSPPPQTEKSHINPDIAKIISSPILQSIIYLIREMGSNLRNDEFLASCNVTLTGSHAYDSKPSALGSSNSFQIDNLLDAKDDVVLYFYLKNVEILFITWLNFLNFGNNQFIQNNNTVADNYLTRLIRYIEITMDGLYRTMDIGDIKQQQKDKKQPYFGNTTEKGQFPSNINYQAPPASYPLPTDHGNSYRYNGHYSYPRETQPKAQYQPAYDTSHQPIAQQALSYHQYLLYPPGQSQPLYNYSSAPPAASSVSAPSHLQPQPAETSSLHSFHPPLLVSGPVQTDLLVSVNREARATESISLPPLRSTSDGSIKAVAPNYVALHDTDNHERSQPVVSVNTGDNTAENVKSNSIFNLIHGSQ